MNKVKPSKSFTTSELLGEGNYGGHTVTVVTATGAINIRKGSATGQIMDVIPIGTAAGNTKTYPNTVQMDGAGIFIDFAGGATGTVVILYE